MVVYPIIYKVLYIPGGAGFCPSTETPRSLDHRFVDIPWNYPCQLAASLPTRNASKKKKKWNYPSPRMLARHHQNFSMFSFGNPNRKPGTCHDGILPRRLAPNGRAPCKSLKLTQAPRAPLHPKVNRTPLLGWWTEISRRSSFFSSPPFFVYTVFPLPPKKKMYLKGFFLSEPKIPRIPKENHGGCFFSGCGENIFTLTNHESLTTLMEKRRVRLDPPCGDTNGTDGAENDKIPHSRPGRSSSD